MKRESTTPRLQWQRIVKAQGLLYHTLADGKPYWDESHCYELTSAEVGAITDATRDLHAMYLAAGQHIIDHDRFAELNIGQESRALILKTWDEQATSIYGRFDLAYDGQTIKLLEYNADTPTALLEAAVIQRNWKLDIRSGYGQCNCIGDLLVAAWRKFIAKTSDPNYLVRWPKRPRQHDDAELPDGNAARGGRRSSPDSSAAYRARQSYRTVR